MIYRILQDDFKDLLEQVIQISIINVRIKPLRQMHDDWCGFLKLHFSLDLLPTMHGGD